MSSQIEAIARLANEFSHLPGVGAKTATRFAHYIIEQPKETAENFASAILNAKENVAFCPKCGYFTENGKPCHFCATRKQDVVCVVADPRDVMAIENVHGFSGAYHVLHGVISPLAGKGPNDIKVKELLARVEADGVKEVILATNPDIEGEATAMYIARLLKPLGVKCTRIAQGVQMGANIEFADSATLSKALENRKEI